MDESRIKDLIADHLAVPLADVNDNALFRLDLGADSLDLIQLAMRLEGELGIAVDDEEVEQCVTVGDALRVLRTKCGQECVDELQG